MQDVTERDWVFDEHLDADDQDIIVETEDGLRTVCVVHNHYDTDATEPESALKVARLITTAGQGRSLAEHVWAAFGPDGDGTYDPEMLASQAKKLIDKAEGLDE